MSSLEPHRGNPAGASDRLPILDLLRGVAVCGILPVNIIVMGTVGASQGRIFPMHWDADWIAWSWQRIFLEGPMRGLFMMLFGVGMLLMLRRAEGIGARPEPLDAWARRCLILMALGVLQCAVLFWPGEILWTIGLSGLALLAFRTARPRTLWTVAIIIMLGVTALRTWDTAQTANQMSVAAAASPSRENGEPIGQGELAALEAVRAMQAANYPSASALQSEIERRTALPSLWGWSLSGWSARHLGIWSWWGVAECLSFMLVGMALVRGGWFTTKFSVHRSLLVAAAGCSLGLLIRGADFAWAARTGFELDLARFDPAIAVLRSIVYEPARLALTLGYFGLLQALFALGALGQARVLRSMGRMALTLYCLQSLATSVVFYGFGMLGRFGYADLLLVSIAIWLISAVAAVSWLNRFQYGPLEGLVRTLAYGRPVEWRVGGSLKDAS